ncbi:MAG: hypothetical protein J7K39_02030 [Bacteroidales bacterium]|nr:hypothetical protein [Bacteroidales bacterium]
MNKINNSLVIFIFLAVVSLLFLNSCTNSFDERIAKQVETKCSDFSTPESCIIGLNEITEFDWNNVYVFASMTMPDEISNIIGFDCDCSHVKDNYTRIVFTKDNMIVFQDQYYGLSSLVQFRSVNKADKYLHYSKTEAKFYAIKRNNTLSNGYFYDLYPVSGERKPRFSR